MDTITLPQNATEMTEAVRKAVESAQDQVLSFHRNAASLVAKLPNLPKVSSWSPLDAVGADKLDVADALDKMFDLRSAQLESDQKFVRELVGVWSGVAEAATAKTTTTRARSASKS